MQAGSAHFLQIDSSRGLSLILSSHGPTWMKGDTKRRGIAAGGNWIIDHVKIIDAFPAEERLAIISEETTGTGGAPYNVLVNLATLDPSLPLQAIGKVGNDEDGRRIMQHLGSLNIDAKQMEQTSAAPTSYTDVVTVASTGKRTFFHNLGANALLRAEDFQIDELHARILHLGYLMLLRGMGMVDKDEPSLTGAARVLRDAQQAGIRTSVDMVTDLGPRVKEVVWPALPFTSFWITNEHEAAAVAEIAVRNQSGELILENLSQIAVRLFELGVRELVVIHAPEGGYWHPRKGEARWMQSLQLPNNWIRGTAGAGDAFCAGILYGIHQNWTCEATLQLAIANAAQSLSEASCTAGLKPLRETLSLWDKFGP